MANRRGSGPGPTEDQISIANAMAKSMQDVLAIAQKVETSFINQTKAIKEMCEAMECLRSPETTNNLRQINENLGQITRNIQGLIGVGAELTNISTQAGVANSELRNINNNINGINPENIRNVSGALDDTSRSGREAGGVFNKLQGITKSLGKALRGGLGMAANAAAGAISSIVSGLRMYFNLARAGLGILGSLAKGFFNIGKALLAIPISMFKSLFDAAESGSTGISELAEALNELRKEFGSLTGPTNSAIQSMAYGMKDLSQYGVNVFQTFGTVAERMKELLELFKTAGPNLRSFSEELVRNNGSILVFQRGLGLTAESIEALALRSRSEGKEITNTLIDITKHAAAMGKRFNLDAKVISREMGKASQDMTHFGNISQKQIGVAVSYAQKLGIQLDKITGSFDKFSTFDDAAENISKINEAFNANIDVGEVMMEQDPAKQFEIIRKGLLAQGIQGEKLSFAQRKLLEGVTGWDSATQIAALSTKNAGIALSDFQKEADKAEKKTMDQTEAIKNLTDAMHKNLKAGETPSGKGLFGKFIEGMSTALNVHPAFMKIMTNIRKMFINAFQAGRKFGDFLINNFPGITKILEGFAGVLDPAKFQIIFGKITDIFAKFIKTLKTDPKAAFKNLMEDLKKTFFDFFKAEGPAGGKLLDGFKEFFGVFRDIIAGAIPYIMDTLAEGISKLADFISNPKKYIEEATAKAKAAAKAGKGAGSFMAPIYVSIIESWPKLKEALEKLFVSLKKAVFDFAEKHHIKEAIIKWFSVRALIGAVQGVLAGAIPAAIQLGLSGAEGGAAGAFKKFFGSAFGKVAIFTIIADAAINVSEAMHKFTGELEAKGFEPATAKIAAGTTGLINTLTLGLLPPGVQSVIAEQIAKLADSVFEATEKAFGPDFSQGLKQFLSGAFDVLGGLGDILIGIFKGDNLKIDQGVANLVDGLFAIFEGALNMLVDLGKKLGNILGTVIIAIIQSVIPKIPYIITKLAEILMRIIKAAFEFVGQFIGGIFEALGFKKFGEEIKQFFHAFGSIFGDAADGVKNIANELKNLSWGQIIKDFSEFFTLLGQSLSESWTNVKRWASDYMASLAMPFIDAWRDISQFFSDVWGKVTEVFGQIGTFISNTWTYIKTAIGSAIDSINDTVGRAFDFVTAPFKRAWEWLSENFSLQKFEELGGQILDGLLNGLANLKKKVEEKFLGAVDSVKSALGIASPSKVFQEIGGNMVDGLMTNLTAVAEKVKKAVEKITPIVDEIFTTITESVKANFDKVYDVVVEITDKILSYLERNIPRGLEIFKTFKEGVLELFGADAFFKIFEQVVEGVKKGLKGLENLPIFGQIIKIAEKVFKISSPSKVFEDIGKNVSDGFSKGTEDMPQNAQKTFSEITTSSQSMSMPPDLLPEKLEENISKMSRFAETLTSVSKAISGFTAVGAIAAAKATEDMIAAAQKLESSLEKGADLDIDTKLKVFASRFGKNLGASGGYKVQARDVVLNVNFKVAIDAQQLEGAIISGGSSKIKERINMIIDALPDTDFAKAETAKLQSKKL